MDLFGDTEAILNPVVSNSHNIMDCPGGKLVYNYLYTSYNSN